ncbi:biotin-dependent carboxyltransferase family protein [Palleronia caenipelagi]|uniref:Urea amidolyase n=1 Tax=Palleronia caenipelagi TaxID=2489174 RepID=A0A547QAW3_9RHOB|nr:urea amidolyase [Palleronia caenipelagi]TRD23528.1 urea amidolyase [Palleronia caenipelagi]
MSRSLIIRRAGPMMTVQDPGRPGYLGRGLSRGGAADRLALAEGAALLEQSGDLAALEMAGAGGVFEAACDLRIALTGAPMRAEIDGAAIAWNASHLLPKGAKLSIGGALSGTYGYLHLGGGISTPEMLGSRSVHLAAGLGAPCAVGDTLPVGHDADPAAVGYKLTVADRFAGGTVRIVPSLQTGFFSEAERTRFVQTAFRRDMRGNRMGVPLVLDGDGFASDGGLSVLSEVITPGDIQITGDGTPFVLLSECQTTGGYTRIGTVLPADLPRVAQARSGASLRFAFVALDEAVRVEETEATRKKALRQSRERLIRRPEEMRDLLSYSLIGGVTKGDDLERR